MLTKRGQIIDCFCPERLSEGNTEKTENAVVLDLRAPCARHGARRSGVYSQDKCPFADTSKFLFGAFAVTQEQEWDLTVVANDR